MANGRERQPGRAEWSELLRIGIEGIDEDHHRFFSLIRDLDNALMDRKDKPEIERLVTSIVEDSVRHFENEEKILAQSGYPHAARNAALHGKINGELAELMREFGGATLSAEWMGKALQIREILVNHCLEEIDKSRDFVRKRPQSP